MPGSAVRDQPKRGERTLQNPQGTAGGAPGVVGLLHFHLAVASRALRIHLRLGKRLYRLRGYAEELNN